MKSIYLVLFSILLISCTKEKQEHLSDDTSAISAKDVAFKVLDSHYIDNEILWKPFEAYWNDFTEEDYNRIKPLVIEQDIPSIQASVYAGKLSYEELTLFYLYRIKKYDRLNDVSLNSVIALNPNVVEEAKEKDLQLRNRMMKHPIFGMPILLKDNINAQGMPTTAGAIALADNTTEDAFIVQGLKQQGALILGKTNLSEWAYFFCGDCPSGYSAIGGQTLNPYGRMIMDTGGSSSGSGVAAATNFAIGTVGSETSGSILSPSSQNSIVGLKPRVGELSRSGIVPISSTLDTPGPMTRTVIDNAILYDAMLGYDAQDAASVAYDRGTSIYGLLQEKEHSLNGKRLGAFKHLLENELYVAAINDLKQLGATVIELDEEELAFNGFLTLLNVDMRNDLPKYLASFANPSVPVSSVADVIAFNKKDSIRTMPYGQKLFYGIVDDPISDEDFEILKDSLHLKGKQYFDIPQGQHQLNGFVSINNYNASEAAVAIYPALTVPMGYDGTGKPFGLTFISSNGEQDLYQWAYAYEQATKKRLPPQAYE